MGPRRLLTVLVLGTFAVAIAAVAPAPALAAKKPYEDRKLGYRVRLDDTWTQNPPKLTTDQAYVVGDWYQDAAKFDAPDLRPAFQVHWFAEPKPGTAGPGAGADEGAGGGFGRQFSGGGFDEGIDQVLAANTHLFGEAAPTKDRWAQAERDRTAQKIAFEVVEVNPPGKKEKKSKDGAEPAHGYVFLARLTLDRPQETISVGFFGSCARTYAKSQFQREFREVVRSFEELKGATDSRNDAAQQELTSDPVKRREQVRRTKLVKGWKAVDTKNYILLHSEAVDPQLARTIGEHIEALRAQVYEKLFPPDRPIVDVCIVRVCKDRAQYLGYGAPGASAGYWSPGEEELVFYEEQSNKKDSLRVLYHEAFHQYIHYAVGEFQPHSWFDEGHGDFFSGHDYTAGKFVREVAHDRTTTAKQAKRSAKRPPLREWVRWDQSQYYGENKLGLTMHENYALGWSLVWFLRTTKDPRWQGVCDRYFKAMKLAVNGPREAEERHRKELEEWERKSKDDPTLPRPEWKPDTYAAGDPLEHALAEAFRGIDWDALEKDWLAADE
jgi:hypothetical protein